MKQSVELDVKEEDTTAVPMSAYWSMSFCDYFNIIGAMFVFELLTWKFKIKDWDSCKWV